MLQEETEEDVWCRTKSGDGSKSQGSTIQGSAGGNSSRFRGTGGHDLIKRANREIRVRKSGKGRRGGIPPIPTRSSHNPWIKVESQDGTARRPVDWEEPTDWNFLTACWSPSMEQLRAIHGHESAGRNVSALNLPGTRSCCRSTLSHCGAFAFPNPTRNAEDHDSKRREPPRDDHSSPVGPGTRPSAPGCSGSSGAGDLIGSGVATGYLLVQDNQEPPCLRRETEEASLLPEPGVEPHGLVRGCLPG